MPISFDDQARLPPLTSYDEVAERQRLADVKAFRQYLVETGTVKCLVQMYQHTAKTEMRLDNSKILTQFLEKHVQETEETREIQMLTEENAIMRDRQAQLTAQADALAKELDAQTKLIVGNELFQQLANAEFWEGDDGDFLTAGLPIDLLYRRFCGQKVDKATRKVLVNLVRPFSHSEKEIAGNNPITQAAFAGWVADLSEDLHAWCRDDLLPRLTSVPLPNEPPYERELLQEIRDTGLLPDHLDDIPHLVYLERNLAAFLDAAAANLWPTMDA